MFDHSPEQEREKAKAWLTATGAIFLFALIAALLTLWPVAQLFEPWTQGGTPRPGLLHTDFWYDPSAWLGVWYQETTIYFRGLFGGYAGQWVAIAKARFLGSILQTGQPSFWLLYVLAPASIAALAWISACPFELRYKSQGAAKWMDIQMIRRADLFSSTGFVLGLVQAGVWPFRSWREVRFWETTSLILLAPPGTGKTVQLVYNLLTDWPDFQSFLLFFRRPAAIPAPSIIVNDPKGENYGETAGWRSRLGPVFKLAWAENDSDHWNPLGPKSMPGGEKAREIRIRIIAELSRVTHPTLAPGMLNNMLVTLRDYTEWQKRILNNPERLLVSGANQQEIDRIRAPASLKILESLFDDIRTLADIYSKRESAIDRQCAVCIPDTVEQHWRITGREALAGFLGFMVARCERDPDLYGEPSYGKVLEWVNQSSKDSAGYRDFTYTGEEKDEEGNPVQKSANVTGLGKDAKSATGGDADNDKVVALLNEALEEIQINGYPNRIANDLTALLMKADKERGSVISTAAGSINIFKNATVRSATSSSDFSLEDLRGLPNPAWPRRAGPLFWFRQLFSPIPRYLPVSVYLVVPLDMAEALGRVTGLFIDWAAEGSMSQDKKWATRKGRRPVQFWLDEFWTLPPLQSIRKIPAFGRGLWVSMYLVGQSFAQIGSKFKADGANAVDELKDSVNYTITPTQNSKKTADEISEVIGKRTVISIQRSQTKGLGATFQNGFQYNESQSLQGLPLIRTDEILSLRKLDGKKKVRGHQLVIVTGAKNTPIKATVPTWFWDSRLQKRAGLDVLPWRQRIALRGESAETVREEGTRAVPLQIKTAPARTVTNPAAQPRYDSSSGLPI